MTSALHSSAGEFVLSAQIPVVPPDETPSLQGVRPLSSEEAGQLAADASLVRSVAGVAPYRRVVTAYEQLSDAADSAQTSPDGRPSARAAAALGRGLSAVAFALRELPAALASSLATNLPGEVDPASQFAAASSEVTQRTEYRLAIHLGALQPDRLVVLRNDSGFELVAPSNVAGAWAEAAALDEVPSALGILHTVERALDDAARLVSQWVLGHREPIDSACRRISALDGEVFQGASLVVEFAPRDDDGAPEMKNFHPLPMAEVAATQYAIARAQAVIDAGDRAPALRGPTGLTGETIEAILDTRPDERDAQQRLEGTSPDARDRPVDMVALVGHLQLGALRLERAWSRALEDEDVATLVGEWASLIHALMGALQRDDETLPAEERHLDLPPSVAELLALVSDGGDGKRRRLTAQAMAIADLVELLPSLSEPTNQRTDGAGRRFAWFSSGAFATLHWQLALVRALLESDLCGQENRSPSRLAGDARLRADPLAEVIHLARALRALPAAELPGDGTDERAIFDHLYDLARSIADGEDIDLARAVLCALAARNVIAAAGAS